MTGERRPTSHTRFARVRARLEAYEQPPGWPSWLYEFALFGFKQGWACLFGALMLALLLGTHFFYPANAALARYDFLTLAALAIQLGMPNQVHAKGPPNDPAVSAREFLAW